MPLKLEIKGSELYDSNTERFIEVKSTTLILEHSLISISKWESKYHIPFLTEEEKTREQLDYYFECMSINPNVDPMVYRTLSVSQQQTILDYIKDPMTATWFGKGNDKQNGSYRQHKIITSELIYYWMIALNIPHEYEKWHLNRLLTLIQVCNEYNKDPKKNKTSKRDIIRNNDALNEARKKAMKSRG